MLLSANTQQLTGYFEKSEQFLYFITDSRGTYQYANPLFHRVFGDQDDNFSSLFTEAGKYEQVFRQCLELPGSILPAEFVMKGQDGLVKIVRWEFSFDPAGDENNAYIHAIGSIQERHGPVTEKMGKITGALPERYKAYEQSPEGLWRFELTVPVSASAPPDEIIEHWRKHSHLAECNDTMARMYGFEKAEDLTGAGLDQFIDFSDENRVNNLRRFIRNHFRSMLVETKEFDRFGNNRYFLNNMEGIVENGMLVRVWGTQQDITEQRMAEEKIRYFAMLMENVSDIIVSQDNDYTVVSWNKAAEELYGYSAEEMIGRKIPELLHFEFQDISRAEFFDILEKKGSWRGEAYTINRFGKPLTVLITVTQIVNESGKLTGYISAGKDITEKRKVEEQLRQNELFYRNLIANSLDAVLVTDKKGIIQFASMSVTNVLGYETGELIRTLIFDYVHPEEGAFAASAFEHELKGEPQASVRVRLRKKDGEWIWCIARGHNLMDNPSVHGMILHVYDDSKRKYAEDKLKQQATLLNNVTDVIVTTDMNRVVTSWNKVSENLTGITESEAVGRQLREVITTDYGPFTNDQVAEIVLREGIWRGEISFTGQDGETKQLLHTVSLLHNEKGESIGMMGVGKDITERIKIEARLQQSESFYRNLAANSLDGIVLTDIAGKIIHCAPPVFKISGYELADMLGRNIFEFVHPDDTGLAAEAFLTEIKKESTANYIVIRLKHATRGWVWCTVRGHNLLQDPVLQSIVIYFTDDTKRKQIEDRLRESESRFRNMIHNLQLGVILQNERSEILVCNEASLLMLGLTENQLLGTSSFDPRWNVIHEDGTDFPGQEHPVPVAIRTRQPVRDVVMGVYRPASNDRVWLLVNAEPIFDDEKNLMNVICSFADITEQRKLSQQLIDQEIQKQKLITQTTIDAQEKERQEIGKELHDNINQHLTTTRLYLEVAGEKAQGEVLEMIRLAHKNLADIVNEIRRLSQSLVPPTLGDLGLAESIHELCDALKRTHSYQVDFQRRFFNEKDLPGNLKLMIFRIIQEQVNNIIRHAQAKTIRIKLQADAENIIFSIADDGRGFDPQLYKKGMGFSNISNRVGLFEGIVDIEAAPGKGCTVTVSIPMTAVLAGVN